MRKAHLVPCYLQVSQSLNHFRSFLKARALLRFLTFPVCCWSFLQNLTKGRYSWLNLMMHCRRCLHSLKFCQVCFYCSKIYRVTSWTLSFMAVFSKVPWDSEWYHVVLVKRSTHEYLFSVGYEEDRLLFVRSYLWRWRKESDHDVAWWNFHYRNWKFRVVAVCCLPSILSSFSSLYFLQ